MQPWHAYATDCEQSCSGLYPHNLQKQERLSKSLLLYTICLILKTSPARLCRLFELASLKKGIIFPFYTQDVKIDSFTSILQHLLENQHLPGVNQLIIQSYPSEKVVFLS